MKTAVVNNRYTVQTILRWIFAVSFILCKNYNKEKPNICMAVVTSNQKLQYQNIGFNLYKVLQNMFAERTLWVLTKLFTGKYMTNSCLFFWSLAWYCLRWPSFETVFKTSTVSQSEFSRYMIKTKRIYVGEYDWLVIIAS